MSPLQERSRFLYNTDDKTSDTISVAVGIKKPTFIVFNKHCIHTQYRKKLVAYVNNCIHIIAVISLGKVQFTILIALSIENTATLKASRSKLIVASQIIV